MSREEMLKRIEDQIRNLSRDELEKVNALLDELEKEYPAEDKLSAQNG